MNNKSGKKIDVDKIDLDRLEDMTTVNESANPLDILLRCSAVNCIQVWWIKQMHRAKTKLVIEELATCSGVLLKWQYFVFEYIKYYRMQSTAVNYMQQWWMNQKHKSRFKFVKLECTKIQNFI